MKSTRKAPSKKDSLKIASYLTNSDREILDNHVESLRREGTKRAEREIRNMEKMYGEKYGWRPKGV